MEWIGAPSAKSTAVIYDNNLCITQESSNLKVTHGNPGTEQGQGRKRRNVIMKMLDIGWTKKWSNGAKAYQQDLVSVLANAPETVLHTELVRTFIDDLYGE